MSFNLGEVLLDASRVHADRIAIESTTLSLDYREFADRADALGQVLRNTDVQANEPIAVLVGNHPLDLVGFAAAWLAGAVVVPVHRDTPAAALDGLLQACGARIAIDATGKAPAPTGWQRVGDLLSGPHQAPAPRALLEGAALVLFTSGSTGKPKGVVLSHRALAGKLDTIDSLLHCAPGERTLLVLNLSFVFANWLSLLTLRSGGCLLMHDKFRPDGFVDALAHAAIARVGVVPTMMRALLADLDRESVTGSDLLPIAAPALRQLLIGGESLDTALSTRIEQRLPDAQLINAYGLTETCGNDFYLLPADRPRFAGCIGRPAPRVLFRIVENGREVADGLTGELQLLTPFAMSGYLDAPELTAAAFDNGWLRTGDIARLRDDGVVELAGRAKEIISRGGNKVSPLEIEQAFANHPDVAAVMATGVSDPLLGERIHLLVVARESCVIDEAALRAHGAHQLARFKQPDFIHVGHELPLGRTGKADRGMLRRQLEHHRPAEPMDQCDRCEKRGAKPV
ncbi:MAG: class I adenylate-forming enzyme family protein [Quisquiliibacterium sp.]